jgi:hypothetical protein
MTDTVGRELKCADCELLYTSHKWCDVVVPDDVWRKIEGDPPPLMGIVLCFNCIAGRLIDNRLWEVPVKITSGPFRHD